MPLLVSISITLSLPLISGGLTCPKATFKVDNTSCLNGWVYIYSNFTSCHWLLSNIIHAIDCYLCFTCHLLLPLFVIHVVDCCLHLFYITSLLPLFNMLLVATFIALFIDCYLHSTSLHWLLPSFYIMPLIATFIFTWHWLLLSLYITLIATYVLHNYIDYYLRSTSFHWYIPSSLHTMDCYFSLTCIDCYLF